MASGHYVKKIVLNEDTGKRSTVWIWVPDPAPAKPKVAALTAAKRAQERAAAAKRAAAIAAARKKNAHLAAQKAARARARTLQLAAVAAARRRAFGELQKRQSEILRKSGLIRPKTPGVVTPPPPKAPVEPGSPNTVSAEQKAKAAAAAAAAAKNVEMQRRKQLGMAQERTDAAKERARIERTQRHSGDASTGKSLEAEIAAAEAANAAAKGGKTDMKQLEAATSKYVAHIESVVAAYKETAATITALFDKGGEANIRKGLELYSRFEGLAAEYDRLMGDGSDPTKEGSAAKFFQNYESIAMRSREWWKRQMQATLDANRREAGKHGDTSEAALLREQAAPFDERLRGYVIDGYKDDGRPIYRKRTLEEEVEYREAQQKIERERLRAQYEASQARKAAIARAEGVSADDVILQRAIAAWAKEAGLKEGEAPNFQRAQDMQETADGIIRKWDEQHRNFDEGDTLALLDFQKRRKAFEKQVYAFFGSNSPQVWDRFFAAPIVREGLALGQAPFSGLGALARIGAGGTQLQGRPGLDDIPEHIKKRIIAENSGNAEKRASGFRAAVEDWYRTPEGEKWLREFERTRLERQAGELGQFSEGFYGDGDLGTKLDALNQFGARPADNEAANLFLQMVADPLNAVPLKFTTYLARANFAAEMAGKTKFLNSTKLGRARDFVKVTEMELRGRKEIKRIVDLKGTGIGEKELADQLMDVIQGLSKSESQRALERHLIETGLSSRVSDPRALETVIHSMAEARLADEGFDYATNTQTVRTRAQEARAQQKKFDDERRARQAAATQAQKARDAKQLAQSRAAKARLDADRAKAVKPTPKPKRKPQPAPKKPEAPGPAVERQAAAEPVEGPAPSPPVLKPKEPWKPSQHPAVKAVNQKDAAGLSARAKATPAGVYRPVQANYEKVGRNYLPPESSYALSKEGKALVARARKGDPKARVELDVIARRERDEFRLANQDRSDRSRNRYLDSDADVAEMAGVFQRTEADHVLSDRRTVEYLATQTTRNASKKKRPRGRVSEKDKRADSDASKLRAQASAARARVSELSLERNKIRKSRGDTSYTDKLIRDLGEKAARLEREAQQAMDDSIIDFDPQEKIREWYYVRTESGGYLSNTIDEDLIDAGAPPVGADIVQAFNTPSGLKNLYSYFSGGKSGQYSGLPFDRVRDAKWRLGLTPKTFTQALRALDGEFMTPGAVGFRDQGQLLFELFHLLRRGSDAEKAQLQRLSEAVPVYLEKFPDSLYARMWQVMEQRALLPWARPFQEVEEGFVQAALEAGLHPNLSLGMIPNGFYPKDAPIRFTFSEKLRGMEKSTTGRFQAAPGTWKKDSDGLDAITRIFTSKVDTSKLPSQVAHFTALRFGDLYKGASVRLRLWGESINLMLSGLDEAGYREFLSKLNDSEQLSLSSGASDKVSGASRFDAKDRLTLVDKDLQQTEFFIERSGKRYEMRPNYKFETVDVIERAYWKGDVTHGNKDAHTLAFFLRLQQDPDSWIRTTDAYVTHMTHAGAIDEAKAIIRDLFSDQINNLAMRSISELKDGIEVSYDEFGEIKYHGLSPEWTLWNDLGFMPDRVRTAAWEKNVIRGTDALIAADAQNQLNDVLALERQVEGLAFTGGAPTALYRSWSNMDGFAEGFAGISDAYNKAAEFYFKLEARYGKAWAEKSRAGVKFAEVRESLRGMIHELARRSSVEGYSHGDQQVLDDLVHGFAIDPAAMRWINGIADEFGNDILETRLAHLAEPLAHEQIQLAKAVDLRAREIEALYRLPVAPSAGKLNLAWARLHQAQAALDEAEALSSKLSVADQRAIRAERLQKLRQLPDEPVQAAPAKDLGEPTELDNKLLEAAGLPQIPLPPKNTGANTPAVSAKEGTLKALGYTEEEYYKLRHERAHKVLTNPKSTPAQKRAAQRTITDLLLVRRLKRIERDRGTLISHKDRLKHASRVEKRFGSEAEALFAPKWIAPWVDNPFAIPVERARTFWRKLRHTHPDTDVESVKALGPKHADVDHMPFDLWFEVEEAVRKAIVEARRGARSTSRTRLRRRKSVDPEGVMRPAKISDSNERDLAAKLRVLNHYGIDLAAYDEARTILMKGHLQSKAALGLYMAAQRIVKTTGRAYDEVFLELRDKAARKEAREKLRQLARNEMFGSEPQDVIDEFVRRYSDDNELHLDEVPLTTFQRRTLEAHFRHLSGVDDLDDGVKVGSYLQSQGKPPFRHRSETHEWLVKHGQWSPRKSELFAADEARSWSVFEEEDYWMTGYGEAPAWARTADMQKGGYKHDIFHDREMYYDQHKKWGVFNRAAERQQLTAEQILKGDVELGLKEKRDLEQMRRFVIERFGPIVSPDGKTLTAMPWLMHPHELRKYAAGRIVESMPPGLARTQEEIDILLRVVDDVLDENWDRMMGARDDAERAIRAAGGKLHRDFSDVFLIGSEVQARLLADPVWLKRSKDWRGRTIRAWGSFNRRLVFTMMSFMTMNIADAVLVKTPYVAWSRRKFLRLDASPMARSIKPTEVGWDVESTLYRYKQRSARERLVSPQKDGLSGVGERIDGLLDLTPEFSGKVELQMKMRLLVGFFDEAFEMVKRGGIETDELARAAALKIAKEEIDRFWPTIANAGPIQKLFNELVPFASYQLKNRVLFLSEALAHPAILNKIEYVGAAIEKYNLAEWEKTHDDEEMPAHLRRRIELPWAPGVYFDLSVVSDASRGLSPIYKARDGGQTYLDFVSQWVRVINPSAQAGLYMFLNAAGVTKQIQWVPIIGSDGFATGAYERRVVGWTEPWSGDQPTWSSVFWPFDMIEFAQEMNAGGWTTADLTRFVGKALFFREFAQYDPGAGLNAFYWELKAKDPAAAKAWLDGPRGEELLEWWRNRAEEPRDFINPLQDAARRDAAAARDTNPWLHSQSENVQQTVRDAYEKLSRIREKYDELLFDLTPGTQAYKDAKLQRQIEIDNVYRTTPELIANEVWGMTSAEWAKQLQEWQVDKLVDTFFEMDDLRPKRADFKTTAAWREAWEAWERQKQTYLAAFPLVAERIGTSRRQLDRIWREVEEGWGEILDRTGRRGIAIEAAVAAGDYDRADQLYLANELDFSLLEEDTFAFFYSEADFEKLPFGVQGPAKLKFPVLARVKQFLDFDSYRYGKMKPAEQKEYLDTLAYVSGMKTVIGIAKASGKFDPGAFVRALKARPELLEAYFKRHPEKRAEWARNEEYIRLIGSWGRLAGAGKWDAAQRVWDSLPKWVKDRYYAKHPEKRARAAQTAAYLGYMKQWVAHFERGDMKGGMAFFEKLPAWVRERYFAKHPEKRAKFEANVKFSKQLAEYFAASDEGKAAYLKAHPELGKWLQGNASTEETRRQAILAAYMNIPKTDQWLRRIYREKYPEIFSQEAIGQRRLKATYDRLARHPEMLPLFEEWVKAIWDSYAENLKHTKTPPPPLERKPRKKRRKGRSAAYVSLHAA